MPGYAKIPSFINDLVDRCSTDTFYVSKARTYPLSELASGALEHLGITSDGESVQHTEAVVPDATNGRWSRYNIDGRLFVRKDLPKVNKVIGGWEVPNFGDWKRGSHVHYSTREVFRKEVWYAKQLPILIDVEEPADGQVTIGFRIDRVFDRTKLDDRDLHLAASLLRENLNAHASIVSSTLSVADWLDDQQVTWELLPRGEASFAKVLTRLKRTSGSPRLKTMQNRYEAVDGFHPGAVIVGEGEFSRYFGFKFREDLVVLENLDYGNALYVMYEDWITLSRRSRIDLLSNPEADYDRIVHKKDGRTISKPYSLSRVMTSPAERGATVDSLSDSRSVFVVHGRNEALRKAMLKFLHGINLSPMEWTTAVDLTGEGSPHIGQVLQPGKQKTRSGVRVFRGA